MSIRFTIGPDRPLKFPLSFRGSSLDHSRQRPLAGYAVPPRRKRTAAVISRCLIKVTSSIKSASAAPLMARRLTVPAPGSEARRGEQCRRVRFTLNLLQSCCVRITAAGEMKPVVPAAVQKHGALHPGTRRRSGKAEIGAITYPGHLIIGIVNALKLRENALAVICSRLGRWDSLNSHGFVGRV